jgi:hypothetical protein
MSNPITVETTPIMIKWGKETILDWSDDITYYYKEEMVASGTSGNRTFDITILRSDTPDFSVSTEIGTRDKITGAINLTNGAPVEKKYLKTLTRKLKGNTEALKQLFAQYDTTSDIEKEKINAITGNKNVATTSSNGGKEDGVPKKPNPFANVDFKNIDISIDGRRFRKKYESLFYPEDLGSNKQDRIRFEQVYTEGRKINVSLEGKQFQRKTKTIKGSVTLPIVTGIGDQNQVDWQGASLNPLQSLGAAGALGLFESVRQGSGIAEAISGAGTAMQEGISRLRDNKTVGNDIQSAINVYLAQRAVGAQGLLSRTTGAILNPNLEMLFSGPKLRNFNFTFKLSPRDADEATQVRKIIRFFKQGMAIKTSSSNVFLKAPNIFKIRYQTFNTDGDEIIHPSINIIKECALLTCDVQYTPDGTYMTYEDPYRTLTSYQLTLSFGELDPIYDSDYTELDQDSDQVIGY